MTSKKSDPGTKKAIEEVAERLAEILIMQIEEKKKSKKKK